MPPRRREPAVDQGPDTRTKLLDAAAKVFSERGFAASSVDDVAAAAGMSKGAVYWNFESKDDLIEALIEDRVIAPLRALIDFTRSAPADQPTAGRADEVITAVLDQPQLLLLFHEYWIAGVRNPETREHNIALLRDLRDALGDALDARREHLGMPVLEIPARDVATAYTALAQGMWLIGIADPDFFPKGLYSEIIALVYEGLVARKLGSLPDSQQHA
jgi:AcrR family transcriptional regulator